MNNNNNNNKYINIFNLKTNDTYENSIFNNKSRNLSGPKTYNTKKIKKSKNIINNNNYNKSEFRISSQPKTGNNKINHALKNKKIKIDSKSNINLISYNNININKINNSKKNINNKNEKEIEKEIFYRKERKNQNNSFIYSNYKENKSFISKDIKNIKKKIENYYNNSNSMKYFENSIKKITIKNNNEDAQIKNDREEKEDELKEFNFEEYKIITQLGQGTFGKIYLVQDKSKQLFSMKKIILSEELDVQSVIKEYRMCYKIKHPNVIKILGIYNNKLDKTTYVVYVLMEVGLTDWEKEIKSYIDKHLEYTEEELINIIKQLTSILAFLQKQNICHRDIKPQNILVFKKKIYKIADFGEAKQMDNNSESLILNSLRGTELYMSPLLFNGLRTGQIDIKHNMYKSDVYSFGLCILYAASTNNKSLYEIRKFVEMNSVQKYINQILCNKYSSKFIKLLCSMLEIYEKNRPDFKELENIMKNW